MKVKNGVDIYFNCIVEIELYRYCYASKQSKLLWGVVFLNCYENSKQESLGQNDTAWSGQNDTVRNDLI